MRTEEPKSNNEGRLSRLSLVAAMLCLTALSCAPAETPESAAPAASASPAPSRSASPSPRDIATSIEASKSGLRTEARKGASGSVDVSETRYYVGKSLVLVEEIVGSPESGRSVAAYYFDDDRLVFFRGRGTRTIFVPGSAERRENFDIEIGYGEGGNVVDSVKKIDGAPGTLEPLDYEAPKARAEMLLAEGETAPPAR